MRALAIVLVVLVLLLAGSCVFACMYLTPGRIERSSVRVPGVAVIEAAEIRRLQTQYFDVDTRIAVICDTATGTLLYRAYNFYHSADTGAMWGVPNGCAKTPQK